MDPRRTLCAPVLVAEALLVVFGLLATLAVSDLPARTVLLVGGGAAVGAVALAGLLRHRWAYAAGSLLQVLLVLSGFVLPVMFLMGTLFAVLWFVALALARRVERQR